MLKLITLAGPSAVGKSTIAEKLLSLDSRFSYVRSATTRPKRAGAEEEYYHLTSEEFEKLKDEGGLIESTVFGDYCYGTPRSEIERLNSEGKIPILVIDIEGVKSVRAIPDIADVSVYLYDSLNTMEERLYARELLTKPSVPALLAYEKRKGANINDYLSMPTLLNTFDAFIKNESVEESAKAVLALFDGERAPDTKEEKSRIAEELKAQAIEKMNAVVRM